MKMITVRNTFHDTECRLRLRGRTLTRRQATRCRAALCLSGGKCLCGGVLKERAPNAIVDDDGRHYAAWLDYDKQEHPYVQLELIDEPAV